MKQKRKPLKDRMRVLYEDNHIIVVNKSSGIMSQPYRDDSAESVVELIRHYWKSQKKRQQFLGVVHRLDKETSGLLVLAKTKNAQRLLNVQFQDGRVSKRYMAFVRGIPVRRRKQLIGYLTRDFKGRRTVSLSPNSGKKMITRYVIRETYGDMALVELTPETGRTHQIRLQLARLGHPIVGESVYSKDQTRVMGFSRCALHASKLIFQHPATGKVIVFEAPMPDDMAGLTEHNRDEKKEGER